MKSEKPGFELKDLPNALIGALGIRTEVSLEYEVITKDGNFEIRNQAAHLELSVVKSGARRSATNKSFQDLLAFIKGHNRSSKQYSMTAPVWESDHEGSWKTSFYIKDRESDAPRPLDPNLVFENQPQRRIAVYRFSGTASNADVDAAKARLSKWIADRGLRINGPIRLAQYDPPFAIPFMRRNEVQAILQD